MSTAVVRGATVTAMPSPTTAIGSTNAIQYAVVGPDTGKNRKTYGRNCRTDNQRQPGADAIEQPA